MSLTDSILGLYSDNKEEYKIHFLFLTAVPKEQPFKMGSIKEYISFH